MKRHYLLVVVIFILFSSLDLVAQPPDSSLLNLERLYSTKEFEPESFGPAQWMDNCSTYTTLEKSAADTGSKDIVLYNVYTGQREIIVPSARLIPSGETKPMEISRYSWSPDRKLLLIFTNTKRVWRQNTRGDYWLLNLDDWKLWKLGGDAKPSTLMFAKFSPNGNKVGYVHENNIYVEDLTTHTIVQLTFDGKPVIINGTFDWVYEEEFGLRDGFRWSPDSKLIAYWQLNTEGVHTFFMINNTDSLYSRIIPIQYPKAGTTNSACRIGVVSADGGETTWFKIPGNPRNNYIAYMDWAANSDEIIIQHLNRLQNTNEVMLGDIRTGNVQIVFTDKDSAWVDVVDNPEWINNGRYFTWVSERDGWRHLYLIARTGDEIRCITRGSFDVIDVIKIDEKGGWIYYIASPDNPIQRYLYRSRLTGEGEKERLSPLSQSGTHTYQISKNTKWTFHTYSTFDTPPIIELVRLPEHTVVKTLLTNTRLRVKVNSLKRLPAEFFRVDINDSVQLDGYMIKPPDFNSNNKYPVLFYVYGEPAAQTVRDTWGGTGYLWHLMLAQQGYLIMSVDNRGTPAPRGRAWRKCIYRQIGILASADQAAAVRAITKWNFVDINRIGVWGWSGGGSMTLNALFRYPDLYHTGMAVAPVSNELFYDTIYEERYMGLPDDNIEGYRNGSAITFAHQLKGNLLIVHGTGDDNVHYQNCEALINELIKHNKKFTMMAYPNRSHGIFEGDNTSRHLRELLTRYLHENLKAGPVPQ